MAYGDNYGDGKPYPLEHKDALNKCRRWQLVVSVNGKRRKRNFNGTQGEARKALKAFKEELVSKGLSKNDRLMDYVPKWIDRRLKLGIIEESTATRWRYVMNGLHHVIGDMRLRDIDKKVLEDAYIQMMSGNTLSGKCASPNYIRTIHAIVKQLFKDAVEDGTLAADPTVGVKTPKVPLPDKKAMTPEALRNFLDACDVTDRFEVSWYLCGSMGLRGQEAQALRWEDVDYDTKTVHIRQAMKLTGDIGAPKSDCGTRDIPMSERVATSLKERHKAQLEEFAAIGKKAPALVCEDTRYKLVQGSFSDMWYRRRDALGAGGYNVHELRHSFATILANSGTPPKTLMKLMGHASIDTTMRYYVHSTRAVEDEAIARFEDTLGAF